MHVVPRLRPNYELPVPKLLRRAVQTTDAGAATIVTLTATSRRSVVGSHAEPSFRRRRSMVTLDVPPDMPLSDAR
jgi:hypothetical protein